MVPTVDHMNMNKSISISVSTSFMTDAEASRSMLMKPSGYEKQRNCDASVLADG